MKDVDGGKEREGGIEGVRERRDQSYGKEVGWMKGVDGEKGRRWRLSRREI